MIPDERAVAGAILDSHRTRTGSDLVPRSGEPDIDAERLMHSAAVVLCHDGGADPVFVYANEAAARRWATSVDGLVGRPSRLTADAHHRADRSAALEQARSTGVVRGYSGERRAFDGTRFTVEDAVLWTVDDLPGGSAGQAATFIRTAPGSTERLRFRSWRSEDADRMLDMYARPEVYQYLGAEPAPLAGRDAAQARIEAWRGRADGDLGIWAVVDEADLPVGTALLLPLPRSDGAPTDAVEIGWHLHPDAWGRGYATEAARALIARARSAGAPRVHAVVYPRNERSRAVCARLGMADLGLTEEWYGVELVDHVLELGGVATHTRSA